MQADHTPRNPADLLGLGHDPEILRLLRACGAEEACITGGASDYDKLLALAEALPLCVGHPLRDRIHHTLQVATGLTVPLCPHTARAYWDAWTDLYWYGKQPAPRNLPHICPHCAPREPVCISSADLSPLPDPLAVTAPDLNAWTKTLEAALTDEVRIAVYALPADYIFTRPNPYHAGEAIRKLTGGEFLCPHERDLLLTQALRAVGLAAIRRDQPLLLRGGMPTAMAALLSYLDSAHALPRLTWIPDDPADAVSLSGLYPSVHTGLALTGALSATEMADRLAAYAAVAPIGRAVILTERNGGALPEDPTSHLACKGDHPCIPPSA